MPSWQDDPSLSQTWDAGTSTLASSPPPPSAPVDDTPTRPAWLDDPSLGRTWNDVDEKEGSGYIYQGGQKTWADTGHAVAAGAYAGVKAPGAGLMEELATTPQGKRYWADTASEARKQAEEQEEQMTPAGKLGIHDWKSPTFWEEQAAPIGAMALPTLLTGGLGAAPAITAGVGGLVGAGMASGQFTSDISGGIEKAPIESLKQDPQFKADLDNGVDEATARYNLSQRSLDPRKQALVAGLGFGAGAFGPYAEIAGVGNPILRALPSASERSLITTALAGGVEGTAAQGTQLLGQNYLTQKSLADAHAGEDPTLASITQGTAPFLGLAFGLGTVGAGMHYHPGIDDAPREGSKTAPATKAEPGKATSVGSATKGYVKTELPKAKEQVAGVVDAAGNQAAAPPPGQEQQGGEGGGQEGAIITPDIAVATAALHPSEGTPESKIAQPEGVQPTQPQPGAPQPGVEVPQEGSGASPAGIAPSEPSPPQRVAEGQPPPRPEDPDVAPARPVADVAATAPRPAPPAGAEPTIREPDQALIAQQGEVKSGARDVAYYPPGTPPPPPIAGVHRAIVQDGEVVRSLKKLVGPDMTSGQVFDYNPKTTNLSKIQQAIGDEGKLAELLKLGSTSKSEAIQRINAGETPAAVVTRDQAGNELKASLGTESTVGEQMAAHEASKASPEHVVQVEDPRATLADRFEKTRQENIAKAQASTAFIPRRTLESVRPEDQAAAAHSIGIENQIRERAQEKLRAEKAAKLAQKAGKNWTKEEIQEINRTNHSADNITAGHRLKNFNDHVAVFESAKGMSDAAKNSGLKVPEDFREGHPYNPNVVRLREAMDLVASAGKGRAATNEALGRFILRDHLINEGKVNEALEMRRQEGALGTGTPADVEEVGDKEALQKMLAERGEKPAEHAEEAEGSITPESRADEEEKAEGGGEEPKQEPLAKLLLTNADKDALRKLGYDDEAISHMKPEVGEGIIKRQDPAGSWGEAFKPRMAGFQTEKVVGGRRKLGVEVEKPKTGGMSVADRLKANKLAKEAALKREKGLEITAPAEKEDAPSRQLVGDTRSKTQKLLDEIASRKAEMDRAEGAAAGDKGPKTITTQHDNGTDVDIKTEGETTARAALAKVDITKYPSFLRPMMKALIDRMMKVAGDMPVYFIKDAEMRKTQNDGTSYGVYMNRADHILINNEQTHPDGLQTTLIHEIFHGATVQLFKKNPIFKDQIKSLYDEAKPQWNKEVLDKFEQGQGMTDAQRNAIGPDSTPLEFITELMTNPSIQEEFKTFKISKQLAERLQIPTWRKASLWSGLMHSIANAFGMPPRYVSVVEAAFSLSERGMHGRIEGRDEALEYAGRLHEAQAGTLGALDRLENVKIIKKSFGQIFKEMGHIDFQRMVTDPAEEGKVRDKLLGTTGTRAMNLLNSAGEHVSASLADKLWTKGLGFVPTDTIRVNNEAKFGAKGASNALYRAQEGYEKLEAKIAKYVKPGDPILRDLQVLARKNPEEFNKLSDLLHDASAWNVHPDEELGVGKNSHLNPRPNPANTSLEDWAGHAHYKEAVDRYQALSNTTGGLFGRIRDYMSDMNRKEINATRNSLVHGIVENFRKNEDFQDILSRVRKNYNTKKPMGNFSDEEREQLGRYVAMDKAIRQVALDNDKKEWDGNTKTEADKFGNDKNVRAIQSYDAMARKPGPYVPAGRFGEYVVRAKHLVPTDPDGVVDPDHPNEVVFDDRNAAYRYMGQQPRAAAETTHYFEDKNGNREYVDDNSPRQSGATNVTPKTAYRVRVQNSHMEMAESLAEANTRRNALLQDGSIDPDSVSQVELTRNNKNIDYGLDTPAVRAMQDHIDSLTHLDPSVREAMKDNIQQVALAHMNGNRLSRNLMKKNNVLGQSDDLIRTLDQRRTASAAHIARSEVMPEVGRAMDDLRDNLKNSNSPDNFKKSAIIREMEDRIYSADGYTGKKVSPALRWMNSVAFLQYLVSPAHVMLHLTHPVLTSIPAMAGKPGRGMFQVYREMSKTYRDMGGFTQVGKGAKHMWGAWSDNWTPTDFVTNIKDTLRSKGASEDLLSALDRANDMNLLHNTGYDFSRAYQGMSKAERGMAIARDWASELTGGADAINRIGTFATEYRISRAEGLDHEGAIRSAADMLSQTQGRFSGTNRARMLQNPTVRAFMQFKNFPMLIYNILAKHTYNIFKPETPEARWQAVKTLTGMIGTGMALTGIGGGTPEPVRLGVTLTNALGLSDSWQEEEDKARKWVANNYSPQLATYIMDGLGGAAGIDIHHRGGFNSLMFQFDPKSTSANDYMNWIQQWVGGTPLGLVNNAVTGATDLRDGNMEGAVENLFPSKEIVDLMKAWRLGTEGKRTAGGKQVMPPIGWGGMAAYATGFTPESVAHAQTAQAVLNARAKEAQTAHQAITKQWQGGDKGGAIRALQQWNVMHPEHAMKTSDLTKAPKPEILGQTLTPTNQRELRETQRAYQQ